MHQGFTLNLPATSGLASIDLSHPAAPPSSASRAYVGDTVVTAFEYIMPPCAALGAGVKT